MIALTTEPPSQAQRRFATVTIAISLLVFLALAPFAHIPLARTELYVAVCESALVVCDLLTSVFLFGQFTLTRSLGVVILAGGYLFSALMALLHELSFPGLFAPTGLLWAGGQTTAWLYLLWYFGFPAAVIGFALAGERSMRRDSVAVVRWSVVAVVLAAAIAASLALLVATVGAQVLPELVHGKEDLPAKYAAAWLTWITTLAALPILWRRARVSGLHLWVLVVIVVWACDLAQAAVFNVGRYSLGWYAGRAFGLVATCFLLAVMILENVRLHRRLGDSHAAEREQRQLAELRAGQLSRLADSLEARVRARTEELEGANSELRRTRDELREAAALGSAARESERARLARELHDELGQALVILKFDLAELEAHCLACGTPIGARAEAIRGVIDQTIDSAHRLATDLRPPVLDVLGLAAAAESLVSGFRQHHSIDVRLRIDPPELKLGEPGATVVFRVLQEALTNIARHSHAGHAQIDIVRNGSGLVLRISDDGRGFDTTVQRRSDALGLLGMRERALMVDGTVEIHSVPGNGTTVTLSIPLVAQDGAAAG